MKNKNSENYLVYASSTKFGNNQTTYASWEGNKLFKLNLKTLESQKIDWPEWKYATPNLTGFFNDGNVKIKYRNKNNITYNPFFYLVLSTRKCCLY